MTVHVLTGVADARLAAALETKIKELADVRVIAFETTSADVIARVGGSPLPDVVLVDRDLGPFPALDLIRELSLRRPQMAVVLIAEEEPAAETYRTAMAAGARGVISRDPTLDELRSRIDEAAEWTRAMRRHMGHADGSPFGSPGGRLGTIIALCGAKGGTGTTTLAVHLSLSVAAAGRSVCLVDMDLQTGDLPSFLDVRHRRSIADMVAAAGDLDGTILAEALYVHPAGPHVLLAPPEGERAEEVTARASRQILGGLKSRYDVVIVDCGSQMNDGNAMAVELADRVIVTATPDLPALRGAKRLIKMWGRLRLRQEEDVAAVLIRHDKRNEIQPDFARKVLGVPLLRGTVPAAFRALEEAANTASPQAAGGVPYRRAVDQLAGEAGLLAGDRPARDERRPKDAGVAATEFAAIMPLIGLVLLLVWQAVLVGLTSMYSSHGANEASRAVAVLGYGTPGARAEVRRRTVARIGGRWGDPDHLHLKVQGDYVTVTIDTPVLLPGWRGPFGVSTKSKIVRERGRGPLG